MHFAVFSGGRCGWALTNVSVSLAAGLALRGHIVDLVTLEEQREALLAHYQHVEGVQKLSVFPLGVQRFRSSIPRLARYLRSRRPDVLFSQLLLCNTAALLARLLSRAPTRLFLLEGTLISQVAAVEAQQFPFLRFAPQVTRLLYPLAHGIIAKSPEVLDDLRRHLGHRAARVRLGQLPNPYVLDRIRTLSRQEVSWPTSELATGPVVLSVGRLAPQKAFDVLMRAFARVRATRPCRLVILGEGPERTSLASLADELGLAADVALPGQVENPWKYMRAAEVFALPSRWEGWSSALTEAAVLGRPIVASDGALAGSTWLEPGKSVALVPTGDVAALARALHELLDDEALRERLGEGARAAAERYDYRSVAAEYERFATSARAGARSSTGNP